MGHKQTKIIYIKNPPRPPYFFGKATGSTEVFLDSKENNLHHLNQIISDFLDFVVCSKNRQLDNNSAQQSVRTVRFYNNILYNSIHSTYYTERTMTIMVLKCDLK